MKFSRVDPSWYQIVYSIQKKLNQEYQSVVFEKYIGNNPSVKLLPLNNFQYLVSGLSF